MKQTCRLRGIASLGLISSLVISPAVPMAFAQSTLSVLIEQCSHGNMAACARGNQLAILQSQQKAARNMPPPGNGMYVYCAAPSICGARGANALPGNWGWTHNLFSDIKRNYPQVWCNQYRNAC
jgi:hypothetical protein